MVIKTESTGSRFTFSIDFADEIGTFNLESKGIDRADACADALRRIDLMRKKINRVEEAVLEIKGGRR